MKLSEMTKPEIDYLMANGNFTEDEEKVFVELSKGHTICNIAYKMCVSERTVSRISKKMYEKISRLI